MEYLDVLMVCSPDRFIPQLVIDHLLIQNIPMRFFISNCKGDGAASARNFVKQMWQSIPDKEKSKYTLMTDNDLLMPKNSVQSMITFLNENSDFGAIALHRNETPEQTIEAAHVNAGPVVFRKEVLEQITYHNNDGCECQGMTNDVKDLKHRIGYLGGFQYGHIENTRRNDHG